MNKKVKIVADNQTIRDVKEMLMISSQGENKNPFNPPADFQIYNIDNKKPSYAKEAKKIMNDYAATTVPFVLLVDLDKNPDGELGYAACYSEEGPITIERINAKL